MLMKVFPYGQGGGHAPVHYAISDNPFGRGKRSVSPRILKGDASMMLLQIDAVPFQWKYSSGALSFAIEDNPNMEQISSVIDKFEELAFAGLPLSSRSILWVLHEENGRNDLHFIIPRQEVHTGKSFNAFPPGWQKKYDHFQDYFNHQYGWTRPDDPARARPVQPGIDALIKINKKRKGQDTELSCKETLLQKILDQVHAGEIQDRKDIIDYLRGEGFSLPRIGKDYITIINPVDGKRHRLKGLLFDENFSATEFLNRRSPVNIIDMEKAAHAQKALDRKLLSVSAYNQTRYPKENTHDRRTISEHEQEAQEFGRTADQGFPIVERRNDRFELPSELLDHAGERIVGSGRGASGAEARGVILGHAGRQNGESQDTGELHQFPATGHGGDQSHAPRSITGIYQKFLNVLWTEIRSLQSDTAFLQRAAIQKKLKAMPKVTPSRKTFATIMQHSLLPHVATLKSITRNLHHAASCHRLKHMLKRQPRHADAQTLTQQVTAFCVQQVAPALDAVTSLKIMTLSFIEKKRV